MNCTRYSESAAGKEVTTYHYLKEAPGEQPGRCNTTKISAQLYRGVPNATKRVTIYNNW